MKSCLGLLVALFIFIAVIGGGALIWYLSSTSEFTRTTGSSANSTSGAPPKAIPVRPIPRQNNKPPVAIPVR